MNYFDWIKLGLLFDPQKFESPSWMHQYAQAPAVLEIEDGYRIYFSTRPPMESDGNYTSNSGFIEVDGENLMCVRTISRYPVLELGDRGTFDEFGIYPVSVIKVGSKYRMFYAGWTRSVSVPFNTSIGVAESLDGKSFKRLGKGPILEYSPNEPFVLSGPKVRKFNERYYLFYIAGKKWVKHEGRAEPVYRIRMAESDDCEIWKKVDRDLVEVKLESDEAQASPDVFWFEGSYHMFFCYRRSINYRNRENGYRIGYAHSTDLYHWTRDDRASNLDISESGWDSEMISYPHVFFHKKDLYMLYLGNSVGKTGFGVAKLNRNNSI